MLHTERAEQDNVTHSTEQSCFDDLQAPFTGLRRYAALAVTALGAACVSPSEDSYREPLLESACHEITLSEESLNELKESVRLEVARRMPEGLSAERQRVVEEVVEALMYKIAQDNKFSESISSTFAGWKPEATLMRREMLEPTVRLNGATNFGSGTIIYSGINPNNGKHENYVLTCHHVLRDMWTSIRDGSATIEVFQGAKSKKYPFAVVSIDKENDLGVVLLKSEETFLTSRLSSSAEGNAFDSFDWVVACGSPLGVEPIPTWGQVANPHHKVDGMDYLQINASTYFGNSGGGIYDPVSRELIGVFSKIYTVGQRSPTVISHMGLSVPTVKINEFLEDNGFLLQENGTLEIEMRPSWLRMAIEIARKYFAPQPR